jgi:hypothetical protein
MGDWRLFVGGPEVLLNLSNLQAGGRFNAASADVSLRLVNNQFFMGGEGFWDEIGQTVSFSLNGRAPGQLPVTVIFTGHQVAPTAAGDPAQDQIWTLVGEFRHALVGQGAALPPAPIQDESARRSVFGWYAQITQII